MAKRRDNKGRVLRDGESQEKNGRYLYRYTDRLGKRVALRSWRLVETDPIPDGKKYTLPLRDMEAEAKRQNQMGIINTDLTVSELVSVYTKTRVNVRHTTKRRYVGIMRLLERYPFGRFRICEIKYSDAKLFLVRLQSDEGLKRSTIESVRGVLRPAFQMAVEDEMIRYNPFNFSLGKILINDSIHREPLDVETEREFLNFVKNDEQYGYLYDGIFILLNTGVRISEFCAITMDDIDYQRHTLKVVKQLHSDDHGGYIISPTKTKAGRRILPIKPEVEDAFRSIIRNRKNPKVEPVIDGVSGFLYLLNNGKPLLYSHWDVYFRNIVTKYNKTHMMQLPNITPHICRHTYCTKMAKLGLSPKSLQYVMGHSNISVTMNVYTHLGLDAVIEELDAIEKRKILQA